jgi:hypothetical protein
MLPAVPLEHAVGGDGLFLQGDQGIEDLEGGGAGEALAARVSS